MSARRKSKLPPKKPIIDLAAGERVVIDGKEYTTVRVHPTPYKKTGMICVELRHDNGIRAFVATPDTEVRPSLIQPNKRRNAKK